MKVLKYLFDNIPITAPITVVTFLLLGSLLYGCGGGGNGDNSTPDPVVETPADPITRTAILSAAQETTQVDSNATGIGTVSVDPATRKISGNITFTGMTATAAHIHTGAPGSNGAPAVTLAVDNTAHTATIPSGTVLTQTQYDDLLAGNLYFNVHSSSYVGGEIRGQIGRIVMHAALDGAQNVPPVTTTGTGSAMLVIDPETLHVSGAANYTGITATIAHIHLGATGNNGGPVVTLTIDNTAGTATVPESTTLTQAQYDDLRAGNMYFNIHSNAFPGGELRGQIGPVAMTVSLNGAQENPPVTTTASGTGVVVVNPVTRTLVGGVGYSGLSASAAHIHTGSIGTNGPPAVTLNVDNNTGSATAPVNTTLTQTQFDDLLAGNLYINIHSTTHASGEIRGQLDFE